MTFAKMLFPPCLDTPSAHGLFIPSSPTVELWVALFKDHSLWERLYTLACERYV